jgi:hypothetical protein
MPTLVEHSFTLFHPELTTRIILRGEWSMVELGESITKATGFLPESAVILRCGDASYCVSGLLLRCGFWQRTEEDMLALDGRAFNVSSVFKSGTTASVALDGEDSNDQEWRFDLTCTAVSTRQQKRRSRIFPNSSLPKPGQYDIRERKTAAHCKALCDRWGEPEIRRLLQLIVEDPFALSVQLLTENSDVVNDPLTQILRPYDHLGFRLKITPSDQDPSLVAINFGASGGSVGDGGMWEARWLPNRTFEILSTEGRWSC